MRHSIRTSTLAAACFIGLVACSHFRRQQPTAYDVTPAGTTMPTAIRIAHDYGCSAEQIESNWHTSKLEMAKPGTPMCSVLGRYGDPISVSKNTIADMQLVSMLHRQPNGRYYNATFVYYADTKVNRELKRPVGKWLVDRVSATR
ncbi:MAG TPA: hypothetical protein VH539_14325 [Gemmatimonadaceae bacterium]|jgi:hypothetical protein